jgi:ArsR family metal-binding transcriptional regulator
MYLEEIIVTFMEPCTSIAGSVLFKAKLSKDVSEILPYINAVMNDAMYNKNSDALSFKQGFTVITIKNNTLSVCKALNETHAYEIIDMIKSLVNNTYCQKQNITPLYDMRLRPKPLDVYKYLPKTNCKLCGEFTCIAFASKLILGQKNLKQCSPLYENDNIEKLDYLKNLIQMLGL